MPAWTSDPILSSCCFELIAPTSVFLSSGSPIRSVCIRRLSLEMTVSYIDSSTRRRELQREHEQREVPRDDLTGNAERPRRAMREGVLELVRPARVIEEVRRGERKIDVARFADRLAPVHRFQYRELTRALLKDARDPEEVLGALAGT